MVSVCYSKFVHFDGDLHLLTFANFVDVAAVATAEAAKTEGVGLSDTPDYDIIGPPPCDMATTCHSLPLPS